MSVSYKEFTAEDYQGALDYINKPDLGFYGHYCAVVRHEGAIKSALTRCVALSGASEALNSPVSVGDVATRENAVSEASESAMVERVKLAICNALGYDFDDLYQGKREWVDDRGSRHDINTPFKVDFEEAAKVAIAAMQEQSTPTQEKED